MATGHGADFERVDAGDLACHDDRDTQCAECHRCGVGDQAQASGVQRVEPQAYQQCGSNRDRGTETGCTFEESAEAKTNQQHLQALVIGDRQDGAADDFELTAFYGEFVEEHRGHDDPCNWPEAVGKSIARCCERHVDRHLEGKNRHQNRQGKGDAAGDVPFETEHGQGQKEEHDRDDGGECGQAEAAERTIELLPGLHMGWPLIVIGRCCWSRLANWYYQFTTAVG